MTAIFQRFLWVMNRYCIRYNIFERLFVTCFCEWYFLCTTTSGRVLASAIKTETQWYIHNTFQRLTGYLVGNLRRFDRRSMIFLIIFYNYAKEKGLITRAVSRLNYARQKLHSVRQTCDGRLSWIIVEYNVLNILNKLWRIFHFFSKFAYWWLCL